MAENRLKSRHEKKGVKMRLNRVLQLTAAVTIALAASIFTISCGEDGAAGADGTGCTISGSGVPYTVTCSGVEVGLLNGEDGATGATGATGPQGTNCSLTPDGISYKVSCGGVSYPLSGCVATKSSEEGSREATINCGTTSVSLCANNVFDPSLQYCPSSGAPTNLTAWCGGAEEDDGISVKYDASKQYCGFKDSLAFVAKTPVVFSLCKNTQQAVTLSTQTPNAAFHNGTSWVLGTHNGSSWVAAGSQTWQDQYCQVDLSRSVLGGKIVETKRTATPLATGNPGTQQCNGKKEKFNQDTWKGEYCGYASATAKTKSKVTTACGDGTKPNEVAWESGYCSIPSPTDSLTTVSYDYCGKRLRSTSEVVWTARVKINASTERGILPANSYKGEYCGYTLGDFRKTLASIIDTADGTFITPTTPGSNDTLYLSKLTGVCNESGYVSPGPNSEFAYDFNNDGSAWTNSETEQPIWLGQYCYGYDRDNPTFTKAVPEKDWSPTQDDFEYFCSQPAAATFTAASGHREKLSTVLNSVSTSANRINEGSYKKQYCAYNTLANFNAATKVVTRVDRECTNGDRPNEARVANFPGSAFTEAVAITGFSQATDGNFWKNEFCVPNASGNGTEKVGISLSEVGGTADIRMTTLFDVFCPGDTFINATTYDTKPKKNVAYLAILQGLKKEQKIDTNLVEKKEYCGYASVADMYRQKDGTAAGTAWATANANPKFTKITTGICDKDANGTTSGNMKPNYVGEAVISSGETFGNPVSYAELSTKIWFKNEYCQAQADGTTKLVGINLVDIDDDDANSNADPSNILRDTTFLSKYCPDGTDTAFVKGEVVATQIARQDSAHVARLQLLSGSGIYKKINNGTYKKEYCGFNSYGDFSNTATKPTGTALTTETVVDTKVKRPKFKLLTTRCGDNKGVNIAREDVGGTPTKYTSWRADYCQADENNRGTTKRVGGSGAYCGEDIDLTKSNLVTLNKDSWLGEYCFDDFKKAKCTGGQGPVSGTVSTDPEEVRCSN